MSVIMQSLGFRYMRQGNLRLGVVCVVVVVKRRPCRGSAAKERVRAHRAPPGLGQRQDPVPCGTAPRNAAPADMQWPILLGEDTQKTEGRNSRKAKEKLKNFSRELDRCQG